MGLTTMFLRQWMQGRKKKAMAEFDQPTPTVSLADLPAAGARWRRNPDGSWARWSYLGEVWEAHDAPMGLANASEQTPGVEVWTMGMNGAWQPYDADAQAPRPAPEELQSKPPEQLPPAAPQKPDPNMVPRPEWTSDWKPGWNEEQK
jgi:outer membrane biosynthesis protein TonB